MPFSDPQRGSRKLDKIAEKLKDRERPQKTKKSDSSDCGRSFNKDRTKKGRKETQVGPAV